VPVPVFCCFCISQKVIQEIFSELDEIKAEVPIYLTRIRSPKGRQRPAKRRPHHRVARPHPWPRQAMVWAPWAPSDIALPPIYSLHRENPKAQASIHEKYCKPPPSSTQEWEGPKALPSTLPKREIIIGGLLHRHPCLRSDA
jgi:hypothetical protein